VRGKRKDKLYLLAKIPVDDRVCVSIALMFDKTVQQVFEDYCRFAVDNCGDTEQKRAEAAVLY